MMIITRKAIDRRTMLKGLGVTLALPLLDSMLPALTAAPKPTNRFGVVYVPNGIMMQNWTPSVEGTAFEFSPILKPLEPFRDRLLVLSGLNSIPPPTSRDTHPRASTRFLTDIPPKPSRNSADLEAGVSMDQILAKEFGKYTQLASLELGLESSESAGTCSAGFSCAYTSTISWRTPTTPLPMEHNPRAVFERLFGDSGSTDPAVRRARMRGRWQYSRFSHPESLPPAARSRARRPRQADRIFRGHSRHRAANPEGRSGKLARTSGDGSTGRHSIGV